MTSRYVFMSFPRSGHTISERIIQNFYRVTHREYSYCSSYAKCKTIPCSCGYPALLTKNHDLQLDHTINDNLQYIVLFRKEKWHNIEAYVRNIIHKKRSSHHITQNQLKDFNLNIVDYYDHFKLKYDLQKPNFLVVHTEDLENTPSEFFSRILKFMNVSFSQEDYAKLEFVIANENISFAKDEFDVNYLLSFKASYLARIEELNKIQKARSEFKLKNFDIAISILSDLLSESIQSIDTYSLLGHSYLQCSRLEESKEIFQKQTQLYPENVQGWINLSIARQKSGDLSQSLETINLVLSKNPFNPQVLTRKADLLVVLKRYAESIELYNTVIDLNDRSNLKTPAALFNSLGHAFLNLKEYFKASQIFELLISKYPSLPLGYVSLSRSKHLLGDSDSALQILKNASLEFPEDVSITFHECQILKDLGQYGEAKEKINTLISSDKMTTQNELLRAYSMLGNILIQEHKFVKAEAVFEKIKFDFSESPVGFKGLASVAQMNQDFQRSLLLWKEVVQLFPDDESARMQLNHIHFRLGNFSESEKGYIALIESNPTNINQCLRHLVQIYSNAKEFSKAKQVLTGSLPVLSNPDQYLPLVKTTVKALNEVRDYHTAEDMICEFEKYITPDTGLQILKAEIYNFQGRFNTAIETSIKLLNYRQGESDVWLLLARIYSSNGYFRLADSYFERAILLGVNNLQIENYKTNKKTFAQNSFEKEYLDIRSLKNRANIDSAIEIIKSSLGSKHETLEDLSYKCLCINEGILLTESGNLPQLQNGSHPLTNIAIPKNDQYDYTIFHDRLSSELDKSITELLSMGAHCEQDRLFKLDVYNFLREYSQTLENSGVSFFNTYRSYEETKALSRYLQERIAHKAPFSIMNLTAEEAIFLQPESAPKSDNLTEIKIFLQTIWWPNKMLTSEEVEQLQVLFVNSLLEANIIGLPDTKEVLSVLPEILRQPQSLLANGIRHILNFANELKSGSQLSSPCSIFVSNNFMWHLIYWNLVKATFQNLDECTVISRHTGLEEILSDKLGISKLHFIQTVENGSHLHRHGSVPDPDLTHSNFLEQLGMNILPGHVYLVDAGLPGKLYCSQIKRQGGISIDMNGVLDYWKGYSKETDHERLEYNFNYIDKKTDFLGQIPKNIFTYWDGSALSALQYLTVKTLIDLNPGWKVHLYIPKIKHDVKSWHGPAQKDPYSGKDYFEALKMLPVEIREVDFNKIGFKNEVPEVMKSDFLRYHLLAKFGGIWSDMDILYIKPLSTINSSVPFQLLGRFNQINTLLAPVFFKRTLNYYTVGFLGSAPGNPFFEDLANNCVEFLDLLEYQSLGVNMLKKLFPHPALIREKYSKSAHVLILPNSSYLPYEYFETDNIFNKNSPEEIKENTFGIHWFNGHPKAKIFQNTMSDPRNEIPSNITLYPFMERYLHPIKLPDNNLSNSAGSNTNDLQKEFSKVYHSNLWKGSESKSGSGSGLAATRELRNRLNSLLDKYNISSILDLGCGDFHWMQEVNLSGIQYLGCDIVDDLIKRNNQSHSTSQISFQCIDITRDYLPQSDLVILRDCMMHLRFLDCYNILRNIYNSKSEYLLTTSFSSDRKNVDILKSGYEWRPLNLEMRPFNLPKPLDTIVEKCNEGDGSYFDKSMMLWKVSQLKETLDSFYVNPLFYTGILSCSFE